MRQERRRRVLGRLSARLIYHLDRFRAVPDQSWGELTAELEDLAPQVVGFDVYDTLLLRELNDQDALRSVLAAEVTASGAWTGSAADYLAARQLASRRVPGEGLLDWYRHPAMAGRPDVERCLETEFELERAVTSAVPGAVDALDRLRAAGISVAFVSDMHLPVTLLGELLDEHELRAGSESLFVSSDVGRWKSNGGLFEAWLSADGLDRSRVAFVGNHPYADHAAPRSLGLAVRPRRSGNPVRYEARLGRGGIAGAAVASASTRARLAVDDRGNIAVEVGAAVAGQAMMAFLLGIRARCRCEDLRQIVFVARDAELPYRMAGAMPKDYWSSVDLHYVHGNRLTWTLAGAHTAGVERWLSWGTADPYGFLRIDEGTTPLAILVTRLGLELDELPPDLVPRPALVATEAGDHWAMILADERVQELVSVRAGERYRLVSDYLEGIGLRRERTLVVDIGWRGQTAAAVSPILAGVLGSEPINYHFGGYGVRAEIDAGCTIERYAFDDSMTAAPFSGIDQCVEMFTGAGQPRATSFQRVGSAVLPVFDEGIAGLSGGDRATIWRAAETLAELMPPAERLDRWTADPPDPEAVVDVLRQFWTEPRRAEGAVATRLLIETDDRGRSIVPLSAPYGFGDLRRRAPRAWRQGSVAASAWPVRLTARAALSADSVAIDRGRRGAASGGG